MRRRRFHPPTWTVAIETVLDTLLCVGGRNPPITDEQDRILTEVYLLCDDLRTRRHRHAEGTNRELAAKYGTCERTVRNWRRDGCPFAKGQSHVLKWLGRRRCAPAGTRATFARQLEKLKTKAIFAGLPEILAELRHVKWLYREHGMQPEDWMRNFRAKRGKVQFATGDVDQPRETTRPTNGESTEEPHG